MLIARFWELVSGVKFKEILEQILVCTAASVFSFWFMYTYLNIPTKLFSIFTFIALLFLVILTYVFNKNITVNLKFKIPSPKLLLLLIYVFCLLIVLFTPAVNESIFTSLTSLTAINWLRTIAGLLLGLFLPGYALISLFTHKLGPISLSVSSILLAVFINSMVTFTAVALAQSVLTWILIVNALIIILNLLDAVRDKIKIYSLKHSHSVTTTLDNENVLMLLLCVFQISLLVSIFILSGFPVPNGDMWDAASYATRLEKNEFLRFGLLTYPPFSSVHLFSVSQLTGLPATSISNMLGLTNIFTVLAFYALVLTLTRKRAVAFLSTFAFTIFGSFTFLVQAVLGKMVADPQGLAESFLQVSGKTMQINSVYTLANIYAYAPVTLDLISVLVLITLFLRKDKGRILYVVEAFLIANLFLLHVAETMYVLIFLLAALLLNLSKLKDLASLTLGVWFGTTMLSILSFTESSILLYIAVLYTAALALALLGMKIKLHQRLRGLYGKAHSAILKGYLKVILAFAILSLYGLLLLVWDVLYMNGNENIFGVLSYLGAAPTFFLPIAFGIPIVISVLYFAKYLVSKHALAQNELRIVIFLVAAFTLAFLLGKGITLASISGEIIYRELRIIQVFGGILFSTVTGFALYRILPRFKGSNPSQKYILAVGLGLLILLGSGSTFLSAVYWTNTGMGTYQLQSNEVKALEFLKGIVNPSDVVLTYSQESNAKVGLTGATTINRFIDPFNSVSSGIPKDFLQLVNYVYLTKQDYDSVQKFDTYMKSLLSVLPVIFNNSAVMIFSVPPIKSLTNSSIPVIVNGDLTDALPKLAILDSLGISYQVYDKWDLKVLECNDTVILTDDLQNTSNAQKYTNWVQNGGHLIILGENEGYYSNLMNIQTSARTEVSTANGLLCEDSYVPFDFTFNLTSPKESFNKDDQVVSWYTFDNKKVVPFVFAQEVGSGKLVYVDSNFPTTVIPKMSNFSKSFLNSIDPYLLSSISENKERKMTLPIEIYGDQSLNGSISIDSDSVRFLGARNVTYSLKFDNGTQFLLSSEDLSLSSANNFTLSLNGATTVQPLHDEYVNILVPQGEQITIFRQQENQTLSYISNGDSFLCHDIEMATVNSSTPLTITARTPNITVNGFIRFEGAFFNVPYDQVAGIGIGALTVKGKMTYNIILSDKDGDRSFGDNVSIEGSYAYDYPSLLEIELPSSLIMTSDVLILVAIVFVCSAFTVSLLSISARMKFVLTLERTKQINEKSNEHQ
jgi:hypothetical protein